MKGLLFNLLEGFVCAASDLDTYEEILAACPLRTRRPFVGPLTYPDEDLVALVAASSARLGLSPEELLVALGRHCFPRLAARIPHVVQGQTHVKTFLLGLDEIVHTAARQRFKDARPPRITVREVSPDELLLRYESARGLCALARGLVEGAGEHFHTPLRASEIRCVASGADACELRITFQQAAAE